MTLTADLVHIDALGPDGEYRTRHREVITTTGGVPVVELSIVPPLYVSRTIGAQRKVRPLPVSRREAALADAADVFETAVIAGLDFESYVRLASRISGLPIAITRAGARSVADAVAAAFDAVRPARPVGAAIDWREERTRDGGAVWTRRGEVFAVHAAGNGPGVHGLWPQALALGYRVAVRPSRREPLTAHRLVNALRQAGFRAEDAVYLPTDHAGADEIIRSADIAMVYGGQDVVDKYADDPTVVVNGPGRAKILITADRDWRDYIDIIVDSIANLGGMACVNTTAVLYEGDAVPLARGDRRAVGGDRAAAVRRRASDTAHPIRRQGNGFGELPGGQGRGNDARCSAPIRWWPPWVTGMPRYARRCMCWPSPISTSSTSSCRFRACGCRRGRVMPGMEPLRRSLVLTAITGDENLIDDLIAEPTVSNVYCGRHPTYYAAPEIPHDGFLADVLMRNKGFIRD